jgi:monovalent cation:H+ antiporter-2, CPA2 family
MEIPILKDVVIILGLSVLIILLFQRLKIPSLLGFLLTGIVAGPNGLSLINASHEVEILAEMGVIFLLFVIGIEFSLKGLSAVGKAVFFGGGLQVGITILATTAITYYFGLPLTQAVFMGFLLSLSSTAIVLKILQERGQIMSPHGKVTVAILIFQDIIVVPMMLFTPIIAGQTDDLTKTLLLLLLKVLLIIGLVILMARFLIPKLLDWVVKTKSKELFILTVVVICFATAWLTSSVGLSLALGAFFAGLIISESEYSHQATANILPFREIFISFFFVSVGMLLKLDFFIANIFMIHLLAFSVVLLKFLIVIIAVLLLKYPIRTVLLTAFSLFQVGEFSFLLSTTGIKYELLNDEVYQFFLAISIITMGATPFLMMSADKITDYLIKAPLPKRIRLRLNNIQSKKEKEVFHHVLKDHLVIIGYGINGQNVALAARQANIPYVIIELDPEKIKEAKKNDEPIIYGDAANDTILEHVAIENARVVVVAISDPVATKNIIHNVRLASSLAYIIVRTRYLKEINENFKLGADEVIPEEFETSIEIFTRVLKKYLVPEFEIQSFVTKIRARNYEAFREFDVSNKHNTNQLHLPDIEIATLRVEDLDNEIVGKTILESKIRTRFGITVLAIKRKNFYITDVTPNEFILNEDIVYLFGNPNNIIELNRFLKN